MMNTLNTFIRHNEQTLKDVKVKKNGNGSKNWLFNWNYYVWKKITFSG